MSNENVKKIPSDAPESVFSERQVGQESQSDWSSQNAKNTQNAQSSQTCSQDSDNCVTSIAASSVEPLISISDSSASSEAVAEVASDAVIEGAVMETSETKETKEIMETRNKAGANKPTAITRVNFVNIPEVLKSSCSFCVWRKEKRNGKPTKIPYDPKTGQLARTNDPSTFSDFATTMKTYALGTGSHHWDGIGFRVSDGIGAIDIDHCIRTDGSLNDVAASILSFLKNAYFERSPSGTGLRGFFRLDSDFTYDKTKYYINNRRFGLEVYFPGVTNRFVTLTGDVYRTGEVELNPFMKRRSQLENKTIGNPVSYFTDEQVIAHASNTNNQDSNEKFQDLMAGHWEERYDSQSDADMALVSILAFWCGCVEEQIDRIFRTSGLMRDKWDRVTGDGTYGTITIRNAVLSCHDIYRPTRQTSSAYSDFSEICDDEVDGINSDADGEVAGSRNESAGNSNGNSNGNDDVSNGGSHKNNSKKNSKKNSSKLRGIDAIQEERDRREREGYAFTPDYRCLTTRIDALNPHSNPRYESFQIGNAMMFVDYYRPIILMNATRNCWYVYDGRVWRSDTHGLTIAEMAKDFHGILLAFANTITSEDTRERFLKRVEKLDQKKFRDIMTKDAGADDSIKVEMDAFDRDKYTFNCHNGTINLLTGEFRKHSPSDFLTKISDVDYNPDAVCPRWLRFMDEVMQGDTDRIRFLQKAIGYAMSGDTRLECMFILYGATSRNGKGTTMETVLRILGGYGRTAKPDMLSAKGIINSSGPSEDVARLNGARMVNISEPGKHMQINASLAKQMTGNNILTARFLRENSFEFKPQFKLFIDTNHLPQISDMTMFESDRIRIIPFNRHFSAKERDLDLKSYFAQPENLSGILNWCLEGFRMYHDEGLEMPKSILEATTEYRNVSDRIMMFATQCLKKTAGKELRSKAVYRRYQDWCGENGFKPENASNFNRKLAQIYVYERRRPWHEVSDKTTMLNDVTWADGEEVQETLVPEFSDLDNPS